jgi:hypothetical protein
MSATTATKSVLNRVVNLKKYRDYVARPIQAGENDQVFCELENFETGDKKTDWLSASCLEEIVQYEPGTMCRITGGTLDGFFAQIQEHNLDSWAYQGKAQCVVISPSSKKRNGYVEDKYLRPCRQVNLKVGKTKAIASMTSEGLLITILEGDCCLPYQTGKFLATKREAEEVLEEYLKSLEAPARNSVVEEIPEEVIAEDELPLEDDVDASDEQGVEEVEIPIPVLEQESQPILEPADELIEEEPTPEPDPVSKPSKIVQFPSRTPVAIEQEPEQEETKNPPESESVHTPETGTEEKDWTYLTPPKEQRVNEIIVELVKLTKPYTQAIASFLWELKFLVFEDERKKRSRKHGTFEQTCRFLHKECGFPLHPNTAREKANAEQQRRLLRQAGVGVEVEKMSDTAALELRRVDALKAEPEVILDAKRKVVENAGSLTKEAIASSIQTVSKDEDWENQYKFRYDKPKKRSQSEKPEPISRKEVEELQDRNTRLRKENETLREQLYSTQEELEQVKTKLEEKEGNEVFLSGLVAEAQSQLDEKDKEIQALMRQLEEIRKRSA